MPEKISIIIPNWNGKAFLHRCISAILHSALEYDRPFECLLMDDASSDGSAEEAASQFPQIKLVSHRKNLGFGKMVNEGASLASGDIIVLINNDLIARPQFLEKLCSHFDSNSMIFGVSGKTVDWDNSAPNHVNMRGRLTNGNLQLTWSDDDCPTETMFVQGGSCAVRKDIFLKFGGFHKLFAPGYWEDYDISYQALKAGFTNLYEPTAVGSHLGQGSMIRAHGRDRIEYVRERNKMLLLALNLTGEAHENFWAEMPTYVRTGYGSRFKHRLKTFSFLMTHKVEIKAEREHRALRQVLTDDQVFGRFSGLGQLC